MEGRRLFIELKTGMERPEFVDDLSGRGVRNMTPEIAAAVDSRPFREWLSCLERMVGTEVRTEDLPPPFEIDSIFRWARVIPGSRLSVGIDDANLESSTAEVILHARGPNLGSAGGPTRMPVGPIVQMPYEGLLNQI